jgi:phosphatidylserine/phosphatidylglycerophosphate/cardiolipin synthase-like enzyme
MRRLRTRLAAAPSCLPFRRFKASATTPARGGPPGVPGSIHAPDRAGRHAKQAILLALAASLCACATDPRPLPAAPPRTAARPAASSAGVLARQRQAVEQALGVALLTGNRAERLVDGPQTDGAMFDAIAAARDHVNLQSYILEDDEIGERLAGLLLAKRAEGVVVNVMYDSVGSITTPKAYFDRLRDGGVSVCDLNPVNPLEARLGLGINNRNHRKILVVDGRQAFTGGINISGVYSGGSVGSGRSRSGGWRDTHLGV